MVSMQLCRNLRWAEFSATTIDWLWCHTNCWKRRACGWWDQTVTNKSHISHRQGHQRHNLCHIKKEQSILKSRPYPSASTKIRPLPVLNEKSSDQNSYSVKIRLYDLHFIFLKHFKDLHEFKLWWIPVRVSAKLKIGWQKLVPNYSFDFLSHY